MGTKSYITQTPPILWQQQQNMEEHSTATNQIFQDTPLYTIKHLPYTPFNRIFAATYTCGLIALFFRHIKTLFYPTTSSSSFFTTLLLLFSDLVLAFMWSTTQIMHMNPIRREEFPENLEKFVAKGDDFPPLDVFIFTADPYKEPPMSVVNTALSVMAYDYPAEKISVYVSDDGGSALTLFAFMEAAKFACHWLPFCRNNNIVPRSPHAFFRSNHSSSNSDAQKIKAMYESMKDRVERVVQQGAVGDEYITSDEERAVFSKWADNFTPHSHPTVIQVLLEKDTHKDIDGYSVPNLIYVSREKDKNYNHHFKAGAQNVLIRVSAVMTNAPIILTLDCDMYSNDPQTPRRVLCYYLDPKIRSKYAYVQFPQFFHGINKNDIYASELKRFFVSQSMGFDGLWGPNHVGTGCFFIRRAFFGSPSNLIPQQIPELSPNHVVDKSIISEQILALAHKIASCDFEERTGWGYQIGYRYGSLVEDLFTGYRLHCEGWRSILCNPKRASFLGNAPISFLDQLVQQKRWAVGDIDISFSKYNPFTYAIKRIGVLTSVAYSQYLLWPIWSFPITVYSLLPQLTLLNNISIFPQVSEAWFILYVLLFIGAYTQDYIDLVLVGGTFRKWWNDQRIWLMRGNSSLLFAITEFILKSCGISAGGFNVTAKVVDDEQRLRYDQGIFEFGVHSHMFVPLIIAALVNLLALTCGLVKFLKGDDMKELLMQVLIAGYGMVNCWPIYEAMLLRSDNGKLPLKTTAMAIFMTWILYTTASFVLGQ